MAKDEDLTEKETLETVVSFLTYVLEKGSFDEVREVNVKVSSQILRVDHIMKKYWPEIEKKNIIIEK